jgi:photosynthetic reaction center H subunit
MALHKISDREGSAGGAGSINTRGWEVRTRLDNEKVGKVDDVLVEDSGEARFLDVDLGLFRRRVLVPVERASPDSTDEVVWVDGFDKDGFERIPEYDGDVAKLNADYREDLLQAYSTTLTSRAGATPGRGAAPTARPTGAGAAEGGSARGRTNTEQEQERIEDTRDASPRGDTRLGRVGELSDYEVADYHADVRGWEVMASDELKIGDVKDLVADTVAMKVRYLDVELGRDFRRSDEESRVLVPIEHARLNEDDEVVWLDAMASAQAREIPAYRGNFDPDYQARVARVFPTDARRNPNDPRS